MQRTIKLTKFTYAESVLNEEGGLETKLQDITIMETNEKKQLKQERKLPHVVDIQRLQRWQTRFQSQIQWKV